jgi:hypothetical protein
MTKLKLFDVSVPEDEKCGGCNWRVSKLYALATSQKEANRLKRKGDAGICGDCMSGLLVETGYTIENQAPLEKCPKCGKSIKLVASARDYAIYGCLEHREFDSVKNI